MIGSEIIYKYFPELSKSQKGQIEALQPLYTEWNSKINVISRTDIENLYPHHVLHSLAIAKYFEIKGLTPTLSEGEATVLDVGTGGGFPGIPLAILYPQVKFLLVDSIGKKITVTQSIADALGLKNVKAVKSRVEELPKGEYPQQFTWIVSRAVTNLINFIPWITGKYTSGALFLKGGNLIEELTEASRRFKLNSSKFEIYSINSWFTEGYFQEKQLLAIRK